MKMRIENHSHIHHIMLYHLEKGWNAAQSFRKKGWNAAQSFRNLSELFDEGTISKSQVERWFKSSNRGIQTSQKRNKSITRKY